MKRFALIVTIGLCAFPACAQEGMLLRGNWLHLSKGAIKHHVMGQQKQLLRRMTGLTAELAAYQFVPLEIKGVTGSRSTVFALPRNGIFNKQIVRGQLPPKGYDDKYPAADMALDVYLKRLTKSENTEFLYKGMHLVDLDAVKDILLGGIEVRKTEYNRVYLSPAPSVAKLFAETSVPAELLKEIPVLVLVEKDIVTNHLKEERSLSYYYAETDIPARSISHMFAFLEINGKPAWYRVVLNEQMIFIPLP